VTPVPGVSDVIHFWRSLPCENFPELRKFARVIFRFEITFTYEKAFLSTKLSKSKAKRVLPIQIWKIICCSVLSVNNLPSLHEITGEIEASSERNYQKVSKCEVYSLLNQIFRFDLTSLPGKPLTIWNNIITR